MKLRRIKKPLAMILATVMLVTLVVTTPLSAGLFGSSKANVAEAAGPRYWIEKSDYEEVYYHCIERYTSINSDFYVGNTYQLVLYEDWHIFTGEVTWESTNENVATIDANGKVTIKKAGYTGIYARGMAIDTYYDLYAVNYDPNPVKKMKYKGVEGWWYAPDGIVDEEYYGTAKNENGWWAIQAGKVDFDFEGFQPNENGVWYIKNGRVDFTKTDVVNWGGHWINVVNGKVTYGPTIAKNSKGWWFVNEDGLASNEYGTWYVSDGKVNFSFNGTIDGRTIVNGKAQ